MPKKIQQTLLLTEEEFWTMYTPKAAPDESVIFERDDLMVKNASENQIWTVLDSPCGPGITALPGFHEGEIIGYCVTETPWIDPNVEAAWLEQKEGFVEVRR